MLDMKTSAKKTEHAADKKSEQKKPDSETPGFEDYLE
jgi:hypothetical protein